MMDTLHWTLQEKKKENTHTQEEEEKGGGGGGKETKEKLSHVLKNEMNQ